MLDNLFKRRVTHNGSIQICKHRYYIRRELASRYVVCRLDAHRRLFEVMLDHKIIKTLPLKELYNQVLEFGTYLELMMKEAEAERRRLERSRRWKGL